MYLQDKFLYVQNDQDDSLKFFNVKNYAGKYFNQGEMLD